MSKQFLRGHVIRILDDQRLLINLGAEQGIFIGDRLCIYDLGEEIVDPQTQENLGNMEIVKGVVEAVHVQEKMTLIMPLLLDRPQQSTVLSAALAQINPSGMGDPDRHRLYVRQDQIGGRQPTTPITVGTPVRTVKLYDVE